MDYLIGITILGLNISPLIFGVWNINIWSSQQIWIFLWIFILYGLSFHFRTRREEPKNSSLGIMFIWIILINMFFIFAGISKGKLEIVRILVLLNVFSGIVLYRLIVQYMNNINRFIIWMKWSVYLTILMSYLQWLGLSQFFTLFKEPTGNPLTYNIVTGFIGNGTHLAGFLGMLIPILLYKPKILDWIALIGVCGILFFLTGTTIKNIAFSGIVVGFVSTAYYYRKNFKIVGSILVFILLCGLLFLYFGPKDLVSLNVNDSGRFEWIAFYWNLCKSHFVTGTGLGTVLQVCHLTPFKTVKHLHLEYLQILLEIGFIGLCLFIWMIIDFLKLKDTEEGRPLKACIVGFLVSCCFTYPMHLWLPSAYIIFCYAALKIIDEEKKCPLQLESK